MTEMIIFTFVCIATGFSAFAVAAKREICIRRGKNEY